MSTSILNDAIETLQKNLPAGSLLIADQVGERYAVDFSAERPCLPGAVVRPADTAEVSRTLAICDKLGQPVVVQGGMSGLSGGATPLPGEISISLERMSGIEELDPLGGTATVLAGTPLQVLQEAAADADMLFPLDLGARGSCTIGGNIATNAGGNQVIRFGMMRALVLGLEAVLADGTVVSSMNKMLKNNAGYDLKQLFIGSEGTLGIVTRAVVRLFPKQPERTTAICAVAGFDEMLELLKRLKADLGGSLSAFEAMWESYFGYVIDHVETISDPFDTRYPINVLIETESTDASGDLERFERALERALEDGVLIDAVVAQSAKDRSEFWNIRDGIGEITPMMKPVLSFDVSMPINDMREFIDEVDAQFQAAFDNVTSLVFGHIGDNNLHITATTGRKEDFEEISRIVYETTGRHSGSVAAEHGVGVMRKPYLHLSRSEAELDLMRRLKAALDPNAILNPERVISAC
jgi:FAD/FMN-containing dehydrogenase